MYCGMNSMTNMTLTLMKKARCVGLDRLDPEIFVLELKEDVPGGTRTSYSSVTVGLKFARTCPRLEFTL